MGVHGAGRDTAELWELIMREKAREGENDIKTSNFVVRYSKAYKISFAAFTVLIALIGVLIQFIGGSADVAIVFAIVLYVLSTLLLLCFLYSLSYRCTVDENKMIRVELWIFKKEIAWNRVKYKKTKRVSEYENGALILYDERGKRLIDFVSEQSGFKNMERLTKRKCIQTLHKKHKKN